MDTKINYWIELSDYDRVTDEAMLKSKRYLYVGFMCHQTIEKVLKAYFIKLKSVSPPYSHSLSYIAKKGKFYEQFDDAQKDFIDMLEPLNIEARYPSYKHRLFQSLTHSRCIEIIQKTNNLQNWIKEKL